jgi:hypothetical protein
MTSGFERLKEFFVDPQQRRWEIIKLGTAANREVARRLPSDRAVSVADREWDNLLILDACRYDLFEAHHGFPGKLHKVRSLGSQSREFLEQNFAGGTHHDTVYVSANPFVSVLDDDVFHAVINLFDDQWDEEILTVRPESVVEATLKARRRYPNKRLISHFMQPHYPFLGERGERIDTGSVTGHVTRSKESTYDHVPSIWSRLNTKDTTIDARVVWDAYVENFELVESYTNELLEALDGKSVVTSDHGNLFGERLWPIPIRRYGHPSGLRVSALADVPWHEVPFETRREIIIEPPQRRDVVTDDVIQDRLEDLGYV